MSKQKNSVLIMIGMLVLIILAGCGQPNSAPAKEDNNEESTQATSGNKDALVLKASIQSPPTSALTGGFDVFLDKIEERSEGQIEFERYYSESLAKAADHLNALSSNIADIALFVPSYTPSDLPLASVGTNPTLWEDVWAGESAFRELYETLPVMEEELEAHNVKSVGQYAMPSYYILSTKPINSIEDIKGLKVIATGESATLLSELGATVVGLAVTDSYEALERGTVDAHVIGLTAAATYGLEDPVEYIYKLPVGASAGLYGMNLDVWNSLSDEIKEIIEEVAAEHPEDFHQIYQIDSDEKSLETFVSNDVEIIEPSEEDLKKLEELVQPLWDKWIDDKEANGLPGKEVFETFKSLVDKYNDENPYK